MEELKKVIVVGSPGSGKSFFSNKLSKVSGVKVYHLDDLFWEKDWKSKSPDDWMKIQEKLVAKDRFIIDGNYSATLEFRIKHAETIIYMDKGLVTCLFGFTKRTVKNLIGRDVDLPRNIKQQKNYKVTDSGFFSFCRYIVKFHLVQKKEINLILAKYKSSKEIIVLRNQQESFGFLKAVLTHKRKDKINY